MRKNYILKLFLIVWYCMYRLLDPEHISYIIRLNTNRECLSTNVFMTLNKDQKPIAGSALRHEHVPVCSIALLHSLYMFVMLYTCKPFTFNTFFEWSHMGKSFFFTVKIINKEKLRAGDKSLDLKCRSANMAAAQ